ncbi:hypothetical protein [Staphylococcus cohnii]|nr:hypothetical protein [Staphylococcus cohnii]
MSNLKKIKKCTRIGLNIAEIMADIGIIYLTYKLYKLSEDA